MSYSQRVLKRPDLPRGVSYYRLWKGQDHGYMATLTVHRVTHRDGPFLTVQEAVAAYERLKAAHAAA